MKLRIKDLSERIRITYCLTARNEYGDLIKVREVTRCRVWARVHALAQQIDDDTPERLNKTTYRITIRWREDIQPNDEIVWRDKRLKIISTPTEFEVRRQWKVFDAQEIEPDFIAEAAEDNVTGIAVFDKNKNLINSKVNFASDEDITAILDDTATDTSEHNAEIYEWTIAMFDTDGTLTDSGVHFAADNEIAFMLGEI